MALYQPSNITPSTFAGIGGGVIDATDNVSISWQVNGTSAMTGFSIAIYQNNSSSTSVGSFSVDLSPAFYGTDANGNAVFYVFEPGVTWASKGLSNGNSYKLKITQYWKYDPENVSETPKSVVQASESVFITRAKPTLSVSPASGTLTSVAQTFAGSYAQTQGDAVASVRWVLTDAAGKVLDDTGTIYTGLLSYFYDGFFDGNTYALNCTVTTASGAEITVTNVYAVSYEMVEQAGGITLNCHPDDSVTVTWAAGADIPGVPSADDYGSITDGVLHLAAERSIEWSEVNGETMAFSSPYCFAWRGKIAESGTETETVSSGTWTLWKTYPQTNTQNESHTMPTNAWAQNPSASGTATRTVTTSISVTSPHESSRSGWVTNRQPINVIGTFYKNGTTYSYKNGTLSTITLDRDIVFYQAYSAFYYDSSETVHYLSDDYYLEATLSSDKKTVSVTVYTNDDAAYNCDVKVVVDIEYAEYYTGTLHEYAVSGDTGISNPVITSQGSLTKATISYSSSQNRFTINGRAVEDGTYTIQYQYTYTVTPNNLYMAKWGGTLGTGTLVSASVVSTTATGGAVVRANYNINGQSEQNAYWVTEYNSTNNAATQTVIKLTYTVQTTGSDSYRSIVTGTKPGAETATLQSSTATGGANLTWQNGVYTVTMYAGSASAATATATIAFGLPVYAETGKLAAVSDGEDEAYFAVVEGDDGYETALVIGENIEASVPIPTGAWWGLCEARTGVLEVVFFDGDKNLIGTYSAPCDAPLPSPVASVTAEGEQYCDYIFLSQNPNYNFAAAEYEPGWDGNTLFYAAFDNDLQAGTVGSDESMSVAIYRREGDTLSPVGVFGSTVHSIRDYAIRSGHEYLYEMFYVADGAYSSGAESSILCRRFRQHTLIEAAEDAEKQGVYHPVNVWRFRDNLDAGGYSNQNQPVLLDNFTPYPAWQPSSPRARAGTLTALLGRFVNGTYSGETTDDMDRLFALSASVNPLFYRDMKGNLYMVRLSGPITQTINNQTGVLEVSVSVPWVEVGDADGAKIYLTEG